MVDIAVDYTGVNRTDEQLQAMSEASKGQAHDAVRELGEEIKAEFENTAPVDSGEYRDSWYLVEGGEEVVYIINNADHAKYVVFPNKAMLGVTTADDPARGILHNVRGRAQSKASEWENSLFEKIRMNLF